MNKHEYIFKANAKLTLYLSMTDQNSIENGFWNISSFVIPINIFDTITIKLIEKQSIIIQSNVKEIEGRNNNVYSLLYTLLNKSNYKGGVSIYIKKNIPISSGLGGGSSNATTILMAINSILKLKMDIVELMKLAKKIGRDSIFFCINRPSIVSGVSDKIMPLPLFSCNLILNIIVPPIERINEKAKLIMNRIQTKSTPSNTVDDIIELWSKNELDAIIDKSYSFLSEEIAPEYKIAFEIQAKILQLTNVKPTFTGSGPYLILLYDKSKIKPVSEICKLYDAKILTVNSL